MPNFGSLCHPQTWLKLIFPEWDHPIKSLLKKWFDWKFFAHSANDLFAHDLVHSLILPIGAIHKRRPHRGGMGQGGTLQEGGNYCPGNHGMPERRVSAHWILTVQSSLNGENRITRTRTVFWQSVIWLTWSIRKRVPFPLFLPIKKSEFSLKKNVHFRHDRERERRSQIDSSRLLVFFLRLVALCWNLP